MTEKDPKPKPLTGPKLPNGLRVSGERGGEADERVRCTRMLGPGQDLKPGIASQHPEVEEHTQQAMTDPQRPNIPPADER